MAEVRLAKISKVYPGNVLAVKEVDLHIQDKEFVVLVGPSGCGKTTILRMVAGLEEITELLTQARDFGLENLKSLALREAEAGRIGHEGKATGAAIDYYFRYSLQYQLGDPEMEGIRKFHELCIKHGVVPPGDGPLVLEGS